MPRITPGWELEDNVEEGKYYLIQCPQVVPDCYSTKGWAEGFDPSLYSNTTLKCLGKAMYPPQVTLGLFNIFLPYFKCHPQDTKGPNGCWAFQPEWIIKEVPCPANQSSLFQVVPD